MHVFLDFASYNTEHIHLTAYDENNEIVYQADVDLDLTSSTLETAALELG